MSTNTSNNANIIWTSGGATTTAPVISPQQQGTLAGYYYNQSAGIYTQPAVSYFLLKLPEPPDVQPEEVFWNGRNLTLGILGSKAEAAFMGQNIVLDSSVTNAIHFGSGFKVIIKYSKTIYHYNIDADYSNPKTKPNTKILDLQLLSTIERL